MPERLECEVLQQRRYINPLTFTSYLLLLSLSPHDDHITLSHSMAALGFVVGVASGVLSL